MPDQISFDAFRDEWLQSLNEGSPSPAELGRRFALKIFSQWRDIGHLADDVAYLDGASDEGIDLIYIERGETDDDAIVGEVWYVVEAKMTQASLSHTELVKAGYKAVDTLEQASNQIQADPQGVGARLGQFRQRAGTGEHGDRIILVIALVQPLTESQREALNDVRAYGRDRLGPVFDVEGISVETIFLNTLDDTTAADSARIQVPITATLASSGENLLIGSVTLPDLYTFLSAYRDQTEDLDQLYEKNVRRFLGGRKRVNKGMQQTLLNDPDQFGLYNNGITLVVKDFQPADGQSYTLVEPYVVNGCQTTRTIWEVFQTRLAQSKRSNPYDLERWQKKADQGVVVTKIVKVGQGGENLLQNITRYTNSQNAVTEKDFITLENEFRRWAREMADKYGLFLEIQRGGWDSRLAYQRQNPSARQFSEAANAFDLLKAYGSGWLRAAGTAFGRNASFVPGGPLYRRIVQSDDTNFGVDDLFAAYHLHRAADLNDFGRGSRKASRRQTRFLFYMVMMDLVRDVLIRANLSTEYKSLTQAMLKLFRPERRDAAEALVDAAVGVIDEYLNNGEEESVFTEPMFQTQFNSDLNAYLKWERLGDSEASPSLHSLMAINKRTMGRGNPSPRDLITTAIQ